MEEFTSIITQDNNSDDEGDIMLGNEIGSFSQENSENINDELNNKWMNE